MAKRSTALLIIIIAMVFFISVSQVMASGVNTDLSGTEDEDFLIVDMADDDDDDDDGQGKGKEKNKEKKEEQQAKKEEKKKEQQAKKEEKKKEREEKKADKKAGKKVNIRGTVELVGVGSIAVLTKDGEVVVVTITEDTTIKMPGQKDAGVDMIQLDDKVMVRAYPLEDDTLEAISIHVIPGKPEKVHRVGMVTAYEAGVSITVENKKGESTTFVIGEEFKILPKERAELLAVGAYVTVISPRDHTGEGPFAKGVVVHPVKTEEGDD